MGKVGKDFVNVISLKVCVIVFIRYWVIVREKDVYFIYFFIIYYLII